MKTTTSTKINKVIADAKKLTSSPIERKMIEDLLKYGWVRTGIAKGFSTDDRTSKIVSICIQLGLSINDGNDAPKGGKSGNFVQRSSKDTFLKTTRSLFKRLENIRIARRNRIEAEASERRQVQKTELVKYFAENPNFAEKIKNRIENFSSKEWRNWVRMKVCKCLTAKFSELLIGATDIREAVYAK